MPPRVLFDTDVLIDASRGVSDAVTALRDAARKYEVAISAITRMELIVGCRDTRELRATEVFVKRFTVLPVDEPASNEAVELLVQYRLSHGLLIPDALIAATAIKARLRFVTKNLKDYKYLPTLDLAPYPPTF